MIIFAADDPLVLNGTYDREGYKPGERARIAKAKQRNEVDTMAKKAKSKPNGRGRSSASPTPTPKKRRTPRQPDLPGTEDRAIATLEEAALEYADVRDQRMAMNTEEIGLKAKLLRLMKANNKTTYHRDGISIEVKTEEETVKVRVKKSDDDEDADDEETIDDAVADA